MDTKLVHNSALDARLISALTSRDQRSIRRRMPDPETSCPKSTLIDFSSNDYLSFSQSRILRDHFLKKLSEAPDVLGLTGSRMLVNGRAHTALEERLSKFFNAETALVFNSGYDANVGFFSCIPSAGDVVVCDEFIHASTHDGIRTSRVASDAQFFFSHNSLQDLRKILVGLNQDRDGLKCGQNSLFLTVESVYSMDGTLAPLREMADLLDEIFPLKNAYFVVDEAHSTGIYGPQGRGRVALFGLEDRVLARVHTFGKALAASGAVVLTNTVIRDYMLNYARAFIYTTSLSYASIIGVDCSLDMLTNGNTHHVLSTKLLDLASYFMKTFRPLLELHKIPSGLISLPSHYLASSSRPDLTCPIIPIITPHPYPLSAYLQALGINAQPITYPTVPKGTDRVRICVHCGNTKAELDLLAHGIVSWAERKLEVGAKL